MGGYTATIAFIAFIADNFPLFMCASSMKPLAILCLLLDFPVHFLGAALLHL